MVQTKVSSKHWIFEISYWYLFFYKSVKITSLDLTHCPPISISIIKWLPEQIRWPWLAIKPDNLSKFVQKRNIFWFFSHEKSMDRQRFGSMGIDSMAALMGGFGGAGRRQSTYCRKCWAVSTCQGYQKLPSRSTDCLGPLIGLWQPWLIDWPICLGSILEFGTVSICFSEQERSKQGGKF